MSDLAAFSDLVGDLYDAALETALFPAVMEKIKVYLDGAVTALISEDVLKNEATFVFASAVDEDWAQRYFAEFMHINPVRGPALPYLKTGDAFSTLTFLTDEEFRASRYYKEWFRPKGLLDTMHSVLERSSMHFSLLSCARFEAQGYSSRRDLERMALIAPHVRRAIGICRLMDMKTFEVNRFVALVDRLSAAVIFTDQTGRIVHANTAAEKMLDTGTLIKKRSGRLAAADDRISAALSAILAATITDPTRQADGAAIMLCEGKHCHVAHVLPLQTGRCAVAGREYGATAAVFIRSVGVDQTTAAASLSQIYDLTRREMSVLLACCRPQRSGSCSDPWFFGGHGEDAPQKRIQESRCSQAKRVGIARRRHRQSLLAMSVATCSLELRTKPL